MQIFKLVMQSAKFNPFLNFFSSFFLSPAKIPKRWIHTLINSSNITIIQLTSNSFSSLPLFSPLFLSLSLSYSFHSISMKLKFLSFNFISLREISEILSVLFSSDRSKQTHCLIFSFLFLSGRGRKEKQSLKLLSKWIKNLT